MRQSGSSALFLLILLTASAGSLLPKAYALDSLQQSKVKSQRPLPKDEEMKWQACKGGCKVPKWIDGG